MIFQSNKSIRALNLESNSVSPEMVMNIIKSTVNTKTLEVTIIITASSSSSSHHHHIIIIL